MTVSTAAESASMAPTVMQTSWKGSTGRPIWLLSASATASLSSGMPGPRVYLPQSASSRILRQTASRMCGGVANDGMPWPKETHPPTRLAMSGISLMAEMVI